MQYRPSFAVKVGKMSQVAMGMLLSNDDIAGAPECRASRLVNHTLSSTQTQAGDCSLMCDLTVQADCPKRLAAAGNSRFDPVGGR